MKIKHTDNTITDTDKLNDLDSLLLEEIAKIHELFAKHKRQVMIVAEIHRNSAKNDYDGCSFFHIANEKNDEYPKLCDKFLGRIDRFLKSFSNNQLFIAHINPNP